MSRPGLKGAAGVLAACVLFLSGCAVSPGYRLSDTGWPATPEEAIHNAETFLRERPNWKIDCSHFVLACYHSPRMDAFLNRRRYHHNLVYDLN